MTLHYIIWLVELISRVVAFVSVLAFWVFFAAIFGAYFGEAVYSMYSFVKKSVIPRRTPAQKAADRLGSCVNRSRGNSS